MGDRAETPADILPALADPERLSISGIRYSEREVNTIVGRFFNDYAALRRYLVDEGYLSRDHGEYWRTGGAVEL